MSHDRDKHWFTVGKSSSTRSTYNLVCQGQEAAQERVNFYVPLFKAAISTLSTSCFVPKLNQKWIPVKQIYALTAIGNGSCWHSEMMLSCRSKHKFIKEKKKTLINKILMFVTAIVEMISCHSFVSAHLRLHKSNV